jgi:hypothetical protein
MANPAYDAKLDRYMAASHADWPARYSGAIAPSDTLPSVAIGPAGVYAKFLYVGVSGNITLITAGDNSASGQGTPVLYSNVPVGWFPVQVRAVLATGTTASGLVGHAD